MRKNFIKLLKTNVEKMSTFRLSMMLMKIKELCSPFHDVDENKGSYEITNYELRIAGGWGNYELGITTIAAIKLLVPIRNS